MFERFTDGARRVVVLAQEESRLLNHNYIGSEHLLLGLLHEGRGIAFEALASLGISLSVIRKEVAEVIGEGSSPPSGHIPFTPRGKKVLELSLREALTLGHNHIGSEHILLALVREGRGLACQLLAKNVMPIERVRHAVIQRLAGAEGAPESFATPEPPMFRTVAPFASQTPPSNECVMCARRPIDCGLVVAGYRGNLCEDCVKRAARYFNVARKLGSIQAVLTMPPLTEGRPPPGVTAEQVVSVLRAAFDPDTDDGDRAAAVQGGVAVTGMFAKSGRRSIAVVRVKFTKKQILAEVARRGERAPFTVQLVQDGDRLVVSQSSFRDFARLQMSIP